MKYTPQTPFLESEIEYIREVKHYARLTWHDFILLVVREYDKNHENIIQKLESEIDDRK